MSRQPISCTVTTILCDSIIVVALGTSNAAMITMRKSIHGFPFLSYHGYEALLGGPLGRWSSAIMYSVCPIDPVLHVPCSYTCTTITLSFE